ncbi:MAG: helix-turn-helix transcriptional regulator [Gammaproteobacteria bacterium]|nr:helix-turn-helix transcriptional regulator [Gammaproteobacteria bacterium]
MNLQIIKSVEGKVEYVLLPIKIYDALRVEIDKALKKKDKSSDYVPFELKDYVDNPVALARINAGITQEELAMRMKVTQAYVSKLEAQEKVTAKVLKKIKDALKNK